MLLLAVVARLLIGKEVVNLLVRAVRWREGERKRKSFNIPCGLNSAAWVELYDMDARK